jgi:hypothetical protein
MQGASDAAVDKICGMRAWFDDRSRVVAGTPFQARDAHALPAQGRAMSLEVALDRALRWLDA